MIKLQELNKYLIHIVGFSSAIWATPYPNPLPGILDGDIDGTGFFNPGGVNTSLALAHPQHLLQFKPGITQWALPVT